MKFLKVVLFIGALFCSFGFHSSFAESDFMVCTADYSPVCGTPKLHECCGGDGVSVPEYCQTVKVSCTQTPTTYSNKCVLSSKGAQFLYEGTCKTETTCPQYQLPLPKTGCYVEYKKDEYGCKKPLQICKETTPETQCPVYKVANPPEGCYYDWIVSDTGCKKPKLICKESPNICTQEYVPVCGYKEECLANLGPGEKCKKVTKTFSNTCSLNGSGYKFLNKGECSTEVITTCPQYQIPLPKEGCTIEMKLNEKGCKMPQYICKDTSATKKVDKMLQVFFARIDTFETNTKKREQLQYIYQKIKEKSSQKSESGRKIISYILEKIQQKINSLPTDDDTAELDDIFKILE